MYQWIIHDALNPHESANETAYRLVFVYFIHKVPITLLFYIHLTCTLHRFWDIQYQFWALSMCTNKSQKRWLNKIKPNDYERTGFTLYNSMLWDEAYCMVWMNAQCVWDAVRTKIGKVIFIFISPKWQHHNKWKETQYVSKNKQHTHKQRKKNKKQNKKKTKMHINT